MNLLREMWQNDEGQDLVEYALIGGLISVLAVLSIKAVGTSISTVWVSISTAFTPAG